MIYKALKDLGYEDYDKEKKKYIWIFPIENLKKVKEVIGKPIEFDENTVREYIETKPFKGKDKILITEFPKIFRIVEHLKFEDDFGNIRIKEINTDVNKEIVVTIWDNIIMKQPLNKPIKTRTVITNIFELLAIKLSRNQPRALRDTARYQTYFYKPMQVLKYKGCIKHHKYGAIERISDTFEVQTKFEEVIG